MIVCIWIITSLSYKTHLPSLLSAGEVNSSSAGWVGGGYQIVIVGYRLWESCHDGVYLRKKTKHQAKILAGVSIHTGVLLGSFCLDLAFCLQTFLLRCKKNSVNWAKDNNRVSVSVGDEISVYNVYAFLWVVLCPWIVVYSLSLSVY